MAALNQEETEILRNAISVLDSVMRVGYDPTADDEQNNRIKKYLTDSKRLVHRVVQMKGYYPK